MITEHVLEDKELGRLLVRVNVRARRLTFRTSRRRRNGNVKEAPRSQEDRLMKRRVVVTGLGAVTPIGNDVESFWNGVKEGKVGIGPITRFDSTGYKATLAAELKDFVAKDRMDPRTARRMEPFSQYAVAAALEAMENSGLKMER